MSWEERWRECNTPWDAGGPSPALIAVADSLPIGRALVPGCGSGHDVFALANAERHVTGLDLAPSVRPVFEAQRAESGVSTAHATLVVGDFFSDDWREDRQPWDLVWDYTFLCAIDPAQRVAWAERMATLLRPEGTLAALLFPVFDAPADYEGPPWPIDPDAIVAIWDGPFRWVSLERMTESRPERAGKEWLGIFARQ